MSDLGTFGSFTTARLGMYAAQKGLGVTGNNIANINTRGYTRQALDQVSLRVGSNDRFQSQYNASTGSGVLCIGVSQIRDPYLDIRYREVTATVGAMDGKLSILDQLSSIFDEVGKGEGHGVIEKQLSDLLASLESYTGSNAGLDEFDGLVRTSASTLVGLLNSYAKDLDTIKKDTIDMFQADVKKVNQLVSNIRDLNESIRNSEIFGDSALEQKDQRNLLIDELSKLVKIDVSYSTESIGDGQTVEKLVIKLGNANPDAAVTSDSSTLINGIYSAELSVPDTLPWENKKYNPASLDANGNMVGSNPLAPPNPYQEGHWECFQYFATDDQGRKYGTNDLSKADQLPNSNYDMFLSELTNSNGKVLVSSKRTEIDLAEFTAGVPTEVNDGSSIIKTEFVQELKTILANVKKDAAVNIIGPYDPSGLSRAALTNAAAALNLTGYTDQAINLVYDTGNKVFQLKVDNDVIGTSDEITLPATDDTTVSFKAGDGSPLGSVVVKKDADTSDFTGAPTGYQFTSEHQEPVYYKVVTTTSIAVDLHDNDLYGELQSYREMLTEKGEFSTKAEIDGDRKAATKYGIPYYENMLDSLANQLATKFNEANTGFQVDSDGNYLTWTDADKTTTTPLQYTFETEDPANPGTKISHTITLGKNKTYTAEEQTAMKTHLEELGILANGASDDEASAKINDMLSGFLTDPPTLPEDQTNPGTFGGNLNGASIPMGGPLFSNHGSGNDTTDIRAANISISIDWAQHKTRIVTSFEKTIADKPISSQATENITHLIAIMNTKYDYSADVLRNNVDADGKPVADEPFFTGTFHEMYASIVSTLGTDVTTTGTMLDNAYVSAVELDTNRDSVSSVDLNDEAMSLMQYQKSYSAAARLMTTLDEVLDKLINGTGVAGR